jgi:hypothetical protein
MRGTARRVAGGRTVGRRAPIVIHEVRPKSPVDRRERRYRDKEERDRNRSRYSPEDYRDKKYDRRRYKDRRYEEDTDYYSDKERERRHRDDREYDRKYSSLRKRKGQGQEEEG